MRPPSRNRSVSSLGRRLGVVEGTGSAIGTVEAVTSETGTSDTDASRTSVPQSASDLERPIKMTPTIMAAMQAASAASPGIETETVSPSRKMPSAIPAIGSAAAIGGKE